jgi:hypothetical protein
MNTYASVVVRLLVSHEGTSFVSAHNPVQGSHVAVGACGRLASSAWATALREAPFTLRELGLSLLAGDGRIVDGVQ